jgi:hypothetical protein
MLSRLIDLWNSSRMFRTGSLVSLSGLAGLALAGVLLRGSQAQHPSAPSLDPFDAAVSSPVPLKNPSQPPGTSQGSGASSTPSNQTAPPTPGPSATPVTPAGTASGNGTGNPPVPPKQDPAHALVGTWTRQIKRPDQLLAYTVELDTGGTGREIFNARSQPTRITYKYSSSSTPGSGRLSFSVISPRDGQEHFRETGTVIWQGPDEFTYQITANTGSVHEQGWIYTFLRH